MSDAAVIAAMAGDAAGLVWRMHLNRTMRELEDRRDVIRKLGAQS